MRKKLKTILERFLSELERRLAKGEPYEGWLNQQLPKAFLYHLVAPLVERILPAAQDAERKISALVNPQPEADGLDTLFKRITADILRNHAQSLAKEIAETVVVGINQGKPLEGIITDLRNLTDEYQTYRLERIVRTESTRVYNYTTVIYANPIPEIVGYRYSVVLDDRTSAVCRHLDGKIVRKQNLRFIPPLHANCRTLLIPLLETDREDDISALLDPIAQRWGTPHPELTRYLSTGATDFWRLFEQHRNALYRYALSLTHKEEDALDLLHETAVRAYEKFHLYDARKPFDTWSTTLMLNIHRNQKRDTTRIVLFSDFERQEGTF